MAESVDLSEIFEPTPTLAHELLKPEEAQYAAQTYISRGWAVTAGPGLDTEGVCWCRGKKRTANTRCKNPGKHAYEGWGNDSRRTLTYEEASKYWDVGNKHWIGRPVDQVFIVPYLSGLVVADVDDAAAWLAVDAEHRPETLWQKSGSGRGGHYLYKFEWDRSEKIPPSVPGRLLNKAGEVKFRGIIAAAPCPHKNGGRYEWQNWGTEIAPAPSSLVVKQDYHGGAEASWSSIVESRPGDNPWVDLQFVAETGGYISVAEATVGRPNVLVAVAASMAKWIESGHTTEEEVIESLLLACEENGYAMETYGRSELLRQINNGIELGRREQRIV